MELSRKMVYVGNLPQGIHEDSLRAAFIPFGELNQIVMPSQTSNSHADVTGVARNFALIEYEDVEDGEHAVFNMNDSEFFGKVIAVHWAKNSQKQALLGKQKAVWHNQINADFDTNENQGRQSSQRGGRGRGNRGGRGGRGGRNSAAAEAPDAAEGDEGQGELVVVDSQPPSKQGLVPLH